MVAPSPGVPSVFARLLQRNAVERVLYAGRLRLQCASATERRCRFEWTLISPSRVLALDCGLRSVTSREAPPRLGLWRRGYYYFLVRSLASVR